VEIVLRLQWFVRVSVEFVVCSF